MHQRCGHSGGTGLNLDASEKRYSGQLRPKALARASVTVRSTSKLNFSEMLLEEKLDRVSPC